MFRLVISYYHVAETGQTNLREICFVHLVICIPDSGYSFFTDLSPFYSKMIPFLVIFLMR